MPGIDPLGANDTGCNQPNNSVSDRACTPSTTVVGFMGGRGNYPSYASNYTALNYSETVRVRYDAQQLSYADLLAGVFFKYAPGLDYPQEDVAYRLRLFATSSQQHQVATTLLEQQRRALNATRLYVELYNASDWEFWKASEEHQNFEFKAGTQCGMHAG